LHSFSAVADAGSGAGVELHAERTDTGHYNQLRVYNDTGGIEFTSTSAGGGVYIKNLAGGLNVGTATGALTGEIRASASVYINDTSNANVTLGLTLNQGANDDQILALKSSDVAHGVTAVTETDTYGYFGKPSATDGGLLIVGLNDANTIAVIIQGIGVAATGTYSTAGVATVVIDGYLKSGTSVASLGADKSILAVRDNGTARFFLDTDGDSHQDIGTAWTNFDSYDDIALLTALSAGVTRADDPLRGSFGSFLDDHRERLTGLRLVTFNDDGHHFVNMSRLTMLLTGAVRQLGGRLDKSERRLAQMELKLLG
jgi:hypothetical protein